MILTIKLIKRAMTIMLLLFAPKIMIISGPKATLGREFIIVKKGSIILARVLNSYKRMEINKPKIVPILNDIRTSYKVVKICGNKSLFLNKVTSVSIINLGDENKNVLINCLSDKNCQTKINCRTIII